jgi:hypothetical protein
MEASLEIVDRFEQMNGKPAALRRAIEFMISYLALANSTLPAPAQRAVEAAKRLTGQSGVQGELEAARLDCWKFLQENSPLDDVSTPEIFAVKAAMRLLYPDPDSTDAIDIVGYFLRMANGFEDHSEQAEALLRRYFS